MLPKRTNFDEKHKIWYGTNLQRLYHPDVSVGQVVLNSLSNDDERVIQISDNNGIQVTCSEMRSWMIRAATRFLEKGLQQEDVIGFFVYNSHNVTPMILGSLLNGHIINALDPSFNKAEIVHMFKITQPKMIFCDNQLYDRLKDALAEIHLDNCPIYLVNKEDQLGAAGCIDDFIIEAVDNEIFYLPPMLKEGGSQTAAILCSSGTTGLPKGICLSHEIFLKDSAPGMAKCTDVFLCFSTLYWFSAVISIVVNMIHRFTRIITDKLYSPELMLQIIAKYKVNFVLLSPTQLAEMVHCPQLEICDFSSVKGLLYIGGAVPEVIIDTIEQRLQNGMIITFYGLTEIGGGCTLKLPFDKKGSAGQITPNHKLKIIDEVGQSLGIGESGEICIKTPCKPSYYYKNPKATEITFDHDGWMHSGDIGYFDEEGYLFVIDRKKDIFKYKGYSISPTDIEAVIMEIPGIREVCVCGLFEDKIASDIPAAAVVKKVDSKITEEEICKYVAAKAADFKQLRAGVYFFDSLPKTPSGKIKRNKIKEKLSEMYKGKGIPKSFMHKL